MFGSSGIDGRDGQQQERRRETAVLAVHDGGDGDGYLLMAERYISATKKKRKRVRE